MSRITKQNGFTLIELIVAIGIFGALSLVSVQALWDTLTSRSKQYSIENSTSAIRPIVATLSQAIVSATYINVVSTTQIQITGLPCRTIQLNSTTKALEQATVTGASCTPPTGGFTPLTPSTVSITSLSFSPIGVQPKIVSISIVGTYKDSLGSHAFQYDFSVSPRVGI